jgi:hypothetical protein
MPGCSSARDLMGHTDFAGTIHNVTIDTWALGADEAAETKKAQARVAMARQ